MEEKNPKSLWRHTFPQARVLEKLLLSVVLGLGEKKTEKERFVGSRAEWRDFGRTEDRLSEQARDWRSSLRRSAALLLVRHSSKCNTSPSETLLQLRHSSK